MPSINVQLKTDVVEGRLRCNHEQAIVLASYSLQVIFIIIIFIIVSIIVVININMNIEHYSPLVKT